MAAPHVDVNTLSVDQRTVIAAIASMSGKIDALTAIVNKISSDQRSFQAELMIQLQAQKERVRKAPASKQVAPISLGAYPVELRQTLSYFRKRFVEESAFAKKFLDLGTMRHDVETHPDVMVAGFSDKENTKADICGSTYQKYFTQFEHDESDGKKLEESQKTVLAMWRTFLDEFTNARKTFIETHPVVAAPAPAVVAPVVPAITKA